MTGEDGLHSVSVAAAIVDDQGRVLVIQRADNGRWEPPGGALMLNERIEEGLRREVCEETGLEISIQRLTGVYKNHARGVLALVFLAHSIGGRLTTNSEASSFKWLWPTEIRRHVHQIFAQRLLDALKHQNSPAIRDHDGQTFWTQKTPLGDVAMSKE
ncbi:ADP-ribose pyrophosphatase YjhB (NUDIX family) [Kineococcus xinjiangensis]|uniref:ADP-ribose pyrophosphatase YjhB (NUDIX family) n=1 Tax=Kineococcus xinjiangensis TaxID=512762 RepID=A0A2S6IFH8_9ACTN|nr:NUDIX hydrolase [Kineococcus xinjiangensis]PPK92953.1 ADP-ribose pyrophosphatase YjhB (NUDIX family) [Kineococcus xinjiangensis]